MRFLFFALFLFSVFVSDISDGASNKAIDNRENGYFRIFARAKQQQISSREGKGGGGRGDARGMRK